MAGRRRRGPVHPAVPCGRVEAARKRVRSRHAWRGLAITGVLVAVVAVSGPLERGASGAGTASATDGAMRMVQAVWEGDGTVGTGEPGLPQGFADEVLPTEGFSEVRHTPDGRIVGMTSSEDPVQTFERCAGLLQERGWLCIDSRQQGRASFLKGDGAWRWAYLDCTAAGDATAVVIVVEKG